jgi:hypothetical protein
MQAITLLEKLKMIITCLCKFTLLKAEHWARLGTWYYTGHESVVNTWCEIFFFQQCTDLIFFGFHMTSLPLRRLAVVFDGLTKKTGLLQWQIKIQGILFAYYFFES